MISPETFKDKYVLVGGNAAAQSLDDKLGSPVLINHAGVDIQATALNNYLDNTYMQKADLKLNFVISAVILTISLCFVISLWAPILGIGLTYLGYFLYQRGTDLGDKILYPLWISLGALVIGVLLVSLQWGGLL